MTAGPDKVIGFHHVGVVVPDMDRARDFYCGLLGYKLISESAWGRDNLVFNQIVGLKHSAARFCMLQGNNSYLELFEYSEPESSLPGAPSQACQPGYRHLSFAVDDVASALQRCIELGGAKINDPVTVPGRAAGAYCHDPFGNLLEFVQPMGSFPEPFNFG